MADLGVNAYRFSIAWTRLMPRGSGRVAAFGLVWVDHEDGTRVPKASFAWYRDRITAGI